MLNKLTEWLVELDVREINIKSGIETLGEGISRVVEDLHDRFICQITGTMESRGGN